MLGYMKHFSYLCNNKKNVIKKKSHTWYVNILVWDCLFGIYNFTTVFLNEVIYYHINVF